MTRITVPLIARALHDIRVREYPVAAHSPPDASGPYPLDVRTISDRFRVGSDGIVITGGPDGSEYHNPVSLSLYALGRHTEAMLPGGMPDISLGRFLAQARYLRLSQDAKGGWQYPVPVRRYRVAAGWYSAMAQGLASSVLLRAYDITAEQSYADAAGAAAALLLAPLREGGCADYDESGRPFLEECPSDPPCHILNGAVFALIGLCEREARSGSSAQVPAAQRLAAELGRFDIGYWSRYDLRFTAPATTAYHALHISLLDVAARLTGDQVFMSTAHRWRSYLGRPACRLRAATAKARFVLGERGG
jgi:hypothetical protein